MGQERFISFAGGKYKVKLNPPFGYGFECEQEGT
jgi:hypothetical protein